jgi:hypothetical protein
MTQSTEAERIQQNVNGERPPFPTLKVVAKCQGNAAASLRRVMEVMGIVSKQDSRHWPSDEEWRALLPKWFVEPFLKRTLEEILADESETLWDYQAWLEAMRLRGWEWWSSLPPSQDVWEAFLAALELPYGIGPFEYLVLASGASDVQVTEEF